MSDPNDVWQNSTAGNGDNYARGGSPRRDDTPRDRSRSPAARAGNGENRGRNEEGATQNQGNNLHVSGLSRSVGERQLEEHFARIGKVVKVQIMMDPHSQESRGFGFVMMEQPEDANAAIEQLSGQPLEGKSITVAHARRGRARTPTPGRYHGVKQETGGRYAPYGAGGYDRPYQPRSYDSRYSDRGPPPRSYYDDRDRRYDERRYDDRRDERRYDDRRDYGRDRYDDYRGGGGGGGAPDPYYRSERERGGGGGYDRRDARDERPRYADERPRY